MSTAPCITQYLEAHSAIFKGHNTAQSRFFMWQKETATAIKIQSYKSNPDLEKIIMNFLKFKKPKIKQCYTNAYDLSAFCPEIKYVIGYAHSMIPMEHAWNEFEGTYFDLTAEIALQKEFTEYALIASLNEEKFNELLLYSGMAGPSIADLGRFLSETNSL